MCKRKDYSLYEKKGRCIICEFISWIEYEDKIYFLTNDDFETKAGKKLLKPDVIADICGHGAIREYYPELKNKGTNKECKDFSTPKNFPKEIVSALKKRKLSRFRIDLNLLNESGWESYKKVEQQTLKSYKKVEQPALEAYKKAKQQALESYEKAKQQAFWKIFSQKKYRNKNWL